MKAPNATLVFSFCIVLLAPACQCLTVRFEINEGVPIDSHVGSVASHMQAPSGRLMYNKVPNPEDASKFFNVDKFSGKITVARELDRETFCPQQTHKVEEDCIMRFSVSCIQTTGGSVHAIADVIIVLRDINDNGCRFVPSPEQIVHIREDASVDDTRIRLYMPTDPDSAKFGHSIQWDLVRLEDTSSIFRLHKVSSSRSGHSSPFSMGYPMPDSVGDKVQLFLGLTRALDYEKATEYDMTVVASDGIHECKLTLQVQVDDADDNLPVFKKSTYNVTIPENTPFSEKIVTVQAHDADAGEFGKVFYTIDPYLSDPASLSLFRIDQQTGSIFLTGRLNYKTSSMHKLAIRAVNQPNAPAQSSPAFGLGLSSFLTRVYIMVEDVNDHAPRIHIFSPTGSEKLTLMEGLPGGQDVAILSVDDEDTGVNAAVECQLKSQSPRDALSLRVMPSEFDHPLGISPPASSRKYKLLATKTFDREQIPEIYFTIECWDGGKTVMRSTQKETIHILDVNDCAPVFENQTYYFHVFEDVATLKVGPTGVHVGTIRAHDADMGENAQLEYRFSSECPQKFLDIVQVDKETGILQSTGHLDREKLTHLKCKVIVNDRGNPSLSSTAEVEIEILDLNDNAPQFDQTEYHFQVSENVPVGTLIGIAHVYDADINLNSKLEFILESIQQISWSSGGELESLFGSVQQPRESDSANHLGLVKLEVSPSYNHYTDGLYAGRNGSEGSSYEARLYTAAQIDREALVKAPQSVFEANATSQTVLLKFKLRAQDAGTPRLVNRVPITLHIRDTNDNHPIFIFPSADSPNVTQVILSVKEPLGFPFTKVSASDPDAAENGTITYRIRAGDPFDLFQLDPVSGELVVKKEYNSGHIGQYLLFIEASDNSDLSLSTETKLLVMIDNSEPLGRIERDIFGFPIHSGRGSVSSRSVNLYIIISIIVGSFVISTILLLAICFVVRRARREQRRNDRYHPVTGASHMHNGSILRDGVASGYLKPISLIPAPAKYARSDPMEEEEDFSEANFSYLTSQPPSNVGYPLDDTALVAASGDFQSPLPDGMASIPYVGSAPLVTSSPFPHPLSNHYDSFTQPHLGAATTTRPDGLAIRMSSLGASQQPQTISRCNFLGYRKLNDDRLSGKRNSLTDRDSGNGDSLDVAASGQHCSTLTRGNRLLPLSPGVESQRSCTPYQCHQYYVAPVDPYDQYIALELRPAASSSGAKTSTCLTSTGAPVISDTLPTFTRIDTTKSKFNPIDEDAEKVAHMTSTFV